MIKISMPTLALLAALVPALQACFPVVATGVGMTAMVAADRRTSGTYLEDQSIELKGANAIAARFGSDTHTNLTSYNRNVLITGEAPDEATKAAVEKLVLGVANVKGVVNELAVAPPSSLASRGTDTFLTSKVKARFIDANKFPAHIVKVVSENGAVYLLGLVTAKEGNDATEIARTTGDVRKVVRVFEYISPEEAKRLDSRPAQEQPGSNK